MEKKFNIVVERIENNKEIFNEKLCRINRIKINRLKNHFDEEEVWQFLIKNIAWVVNLGLLKTSELTEWFTEEELNKHCIFSKGTHEVQNGRFIGIGKAHLISTLHTEVILFDDSFAECYDTSFLVCYNNSKGEVVDCMAVGMQNSEIIANGSRVELFENAKCVNKGKSLVIQR